MKNPFSRFVDSMMTSNQKKRVMLQGWLMLWAISFGGAEMRHLGDQQNRLMTKSDTTTLFKEKRNFNIRCC